MKDLPIQTTTVQRLREVAIGYNAGRRAGIEAMRDAGKGRAIPTIYACKPAQMIFPDALDEEADKLIAQTQEDKS